MRLLSLQVGYQLSYQFAAPLDRKAFGQFVAERFALTIRQDPEHGFFELTPAVLCQPD